jgi:hypothetical protein
VRNRSASRNWRLVLSGESSAAPVKAHQPFGSARRYEAMLWREFSLGNVAEITRQVPGWYDDDEIGEALQEARRRFLLPWEFDETEWSTICKTP